MKFNLIFANQNSLIDAQIVEYGLKQISDKNKVKAVNSVYFTIEEADVNIFFDSINYSFIRKAKFNVLIPNLNMFTKDEIELLPFFDLVIAKTKYAHESLKTYIKDDSKLFYVGWRSNDMANLNIDKNFNECFFNYSNDFVDCQKIIDNWQPDFPKLNIALNKKKIKLDRAGKQNIILHDGLDLKAYEKLFNKCGICICLEERCEYPHEIERAALSRSVIVTLDKGPCSEIFKDSEGDTFEVFCKKKKLDGGLGSKYIFNGESFQNQIRKITSEGVNLDIVVLDYIDCVIPDRSFNDEWKGEGSVMRKYEAMCHELNLVGWTAAQGNRSSIASEVVTTDQMGGSIKKAQVGHVIISVAKTLQQKEMGLATLAIVKSRLGKDGVVFENCKFDNATLEIDTDATSTFLGFEEEKTNRNRERVARALQRREQIINKNN